MLYFLYHNSAFNDIKFIVGTYIFTNQNTYGLITETDHLNRFCKY